MKITDIPGLRLANQQIASTKFKTPYEIVSWMGATQGQDYNGAKWSIGLRARCADADVEKAIRSKKIVRTWPQRGTLHFVAAEDVRWMLTLLTPKVVNGAKRRREQLGLDEKTFVKANRVIEKALRGGNQLMRSELREVLEKNGIEMDNHRTYHILWRAAQEQLVCFGPQNGKQDTFVLLDEWIPKSKALTREKSLAEITRRYFTSHGPATIADFAWWSGLTTTEIKSGLTMVSKDLTSETIDGSTYWMSKIKPKTTTSKASHLLPGFDEYLLGYRDRSAVLDKQHAPIVCPGANGVFQPTIVVNGRVVGTWKRTVKKSGIVVDFKPFGKLTKSQLSDLEKPAEQYRTFMGLSTT